MKYPMHKPIVAVQPVVHKQGANNTGFTIHTGLFPERAINEALECVLSLTNSEDVPPLAAALMSHFIFEYAHPFYDGNGRTGRYLLALWLRASLTAYTVLSVSRVIAENRGRYYRAFTDAEKPLNHGEITLFVMQLLDDIAIAQDQLMENHSELHAALEKGLSAFAELREAHGLSDKDMDVFALVFRYGLFTRLEEAPLDEIVLQAGVSKQTVRARTRRLEEEGLLETTSLRPLRFRLTEAARAALA